MLRSLNLALRRGEILGFLGPNGAGKTTTLRLLLGVLQPSGGSATVLGHPAGDTQMRAHIGFLPADLHLDPRYTVREAIDFFGQLRGGFEKPRVTQLLDRFGLDPTRRIGVSLTVEGPVDAVVKKAAKCRVDRIVSREADLEELFLELYR